jgi:hypothetical protein
MKEGRERSAEKINSEDNGKSEEYLHQIFVTVWLVTITIISNRILLL